MFNKSGVAAPRSRNRKARILAVLSLSFLLAGSAFAIQQSQLSDFSVQAMDGTASRSSDWPLNGRWLVIYVEGRCDVCSGLLSRLTAREYPQLAGQTIIIVGGAQVQDAKTLKNRFSDLATAGWYADSSRSASGAFNLRSAPVMIGVQDKVVHWQISGIPADPKLLHSVLTGWLTK